LPRASPFFIYIGYYEANLIDYFLKYSRREYADVTIAISTAAIQELLLLPALATHFWLPLLAVAVRSR
jgi:hypothetical protein